VQGLGDCVGRMETAISKLTQDFSKLAVELTDWLTAGEVLDPEGRLRRGRRLFYCVGRFTV
jgi:hypothetical protein